MAASVDHSRLAMPIGEAMFTQRAIRRFRPDPIPVADIRLILEAAVRAPNGGNRQPARFLVLTDRERVRAFGELYREAWWAKRREEQGWTRPEDVPLEDRNYRAAMHLAETFTEVPCVVLAFAVPPGAANSVVPAAQNLMLAARALGIGSVPTTLHPSVMDRVRTLLRTPAEATLHFCIPLGYPEGRFGGSVRWPTAQTTYFDTWGTPPPWS
jgi:nitroreductase